MIDAVFFKMINYSVGYGVGSREETLLGGRLVQRLLQKTGCETLRVSTWGGPLEKQALEGSSSPLACCIPATGSREPLQICVQSS